jgi:hypothetical protein
MKIKNSEKKENRDEAWKELSISAAIMFVVTALAVTIKIIGIIPSFMEGITPRGLLEISLIVFILLDIREIKTIITGGTSHP